MSKFNGFMTLLDKVVKIVGVVVIVLETVQFFRDKLKGHFGDEVPESLKFAVTDETEKTDENDK